MHSLQTLPLKGIFIRGRKVVNQVTPLPLKFTCLSGISLVHVVTKINQRYFLLVPTEERLKILKDFAKY